jgi:prepilin-type N-terminal cleavage/methylation domain-containing protein
MRISRAGTWTSREGDDGSVMRAFTLLELLVVLMVVGISGALAFPRLSSFLLREPEPWRSGRKLARLVTYARELAVATESTVVFSLDANTGNYGIVSRQRDRESVGVAAPPDFRGQLGKTVRITGIEWAGEHWDPQDVLRVVFGPEGWGDSMTVTLASSEGKIVILVVGDGFDEIDLVGDGSPG